MKRYFSLALLAVALIVPSGVFAQVQGDLMPTSSATSTCLFLTSGMQQGSKDSKTDNQVTKLQQFLYDKGYLSVEPTGTFGPRTVTAVARFQKANKIDGAGSVGPLTRAAINEQSCGNSFPSPVSVKPKNPKDALCSNGKTLVSNCVSSPDVPVLSTSDIYVTIDVPSLNNFNLTEGISYQVNWSPFKGSFDAYEVQTANYLVPGVTSGNPIFNQVAKTNGGVTYSVNSSIVKEFLANSRNVSETDLRQNFYIIVRAVNNLPNGKEQIVAEGKSGTFSIVGPSANQPIISIVGTPTLRLSYDSAKRESAVISSGQVKITAGSLDARIPLQYGVYIILNRDNTKDTDGTGNSVVMDASPVSPLTIGGDGVTMPKHYIIPAGKSVTFNVSRTDLPSQMFAGTYYASVAQVNVFNAQNLIYDIPLPKNSSKGLTVVGEKSPYITSVTESVKAGDVLTILGARLNPASSIMFDGSVVSPSGLMNSTTGTKLYFTVPSTWTAGKHYMEVSNSYGKSNQVYFNVTSTSSALPAAVTVIYPNGGEQWTVGSTQTIKWDSLNVPASNDVLVRLQDSVGAEHYFYGNSDISNTVPNGGSWSITVPTTLVPGQYKVEVKTVVNGQSYIDYSNNYFTIVPSNLISGVVKSISVKDGNVQFSFNRVASACLQIKDSQGRYFSLTSSRFQYSCAGSTLMNGYNMELTVPQSSFTQPINVGEYYQVCNYDTTGNHLCSGPVLVKSATSACLTGTGPLAAGQTRCATSVADSVVAISPTVTASNFSSVSPTTVFPTQQPAIALTAPNGGESWSVNSTHDITWTKTEKTGTYVKVALQKGGVFLKNLVTSTTNDGTYHWNIPADLTPGTDYKIIVTSTSVSGVSSVSAGNFAIVNEPSILTVTSPNGGESWAVGSKQNITWTSTGSVKPANVKIELLKSGFLAKTIDTTTSNDGTYSWTVPTSLTLGAGYTIKISDTKNYNTFDMSDASFTINAKGSALSAAVINALTDQGNISSVTQNDSACVVLADDLQYGANDTLFAGAVSELQNFLQSRGYFSDEVSGYFGNQTFVAVKAFQLTNGVKDSGYVGALTRAKIQEMSCQ